MIRAGDSGAVKELPLRRSLFQSSTFTSQSKRAAVHSTQGWRETQRSMVSSAPSDDDAEAARQPVRLCQSVEQYTTEQSESRSFAPGAWRHQTARVHLPSARAPRAPRASAPSSCGMVLENSCLRPFQVASLTPGSCPPRRIHWKTSRDPRDSRAARRAGPHDPELG